MRRYICAGHVRRPCADVSAHTCKNVLFKSDKMVQFSKFKKLWEEEDFALFIFTI